MEREKNNGKKNKKMMKKINLCKKKQEMQINIINYLKNIVSY